MSRLAAIAGAAVAMVGLFGQGLAPGVLVLMGALAVASVTLRILGRHLPGSAALLAWGALGAGTGTASPWLAAAGLMLWAYGCVDVGAPRGLPLASWMTGLGILAFAVGLLAWVPLRDGVARAGTPLPMVLALAAIGLAAGAAALAPSPDESAPTAK